MQSQAKSLIIQADEKGYPVAVEYIPTADEVKKVNETKKRELINAATEQIEILQDAIDLELADEGDEGRLKAWKKYRVLLNKLDLTQLEISWPKLPS